jgi:SulP family sulfate permease
MPCLAQVVVLSTSLMAIFHWNEEDKGAIEVVGSIQRGLPSFKTDFALDKFSKLVSSAIVISFVGFMESIAIAKTLAATNKYEIDANQVRTACSAPKPPREPVPCMPIALTRISPCVYTDIVI